MEFKTLTADAMAEVQAITFRSGLRNCNFTFANLVGWQPEFDTHCCISDGQSVYYLIPISKEAVEEIM